MLDKTRDVANNEAAAELAAAADWLMRFERALAASGDGLKALFHPDSHWRDVLALSWEIGTLSGANAIIDGLNLHAARAAPKSFRIDPARAAPRKVTRAGTPSIEAM